MRTRLVTAAIFGIVLISPIDSARADGAYRWRDSSGRTHFGSNPPRDAIDVKSLNGKTFSRYSASRMMRPYQNIINSVPRDSESARLSARKRAAAAKTIGGNTPVEDEDTFNGNGDQPVREARGNGGAGRSTARGSIREPIREESLMTDLTKSPVTMKHDAHQRVTSCIVNVQNTSNIPAHGVIVSFEFSDGTLIPGVGPDSLSPGEEGTYAIPDELLPVVVKNLADDAAPPPPDVSIKAAE